VSQNRNDPLCQQEVIKTRCKSIARRRNSLDIPSQEPSDSLEVSPEGALVSRKSPQFRALFLGAGGSVALATWAFTALPAWAAALLTLGTIAIPVARALVALLPLAAVTVVGLSTRCPERRKNSKEFFRLFLRFFGR